jgi:hypothetical protein
MQRIIYFTSIVSLLALCSCTGQYDNIDRYATDESIYIGKYSDLPYVKIGYKRVEIELLGDSVGRAFSDDIYLGKAKKTVIEYEEADGLRRIVIDSVCSWVNITGLTTPKTYIFTVYTEDTIGNRSIPTEALAKPFTDADLEGIIFPSPVKIPSPVTVEFSWETEVSMGLSTSLFKFVDLTYSYVNCDGKTINGKLTEKDAKTVANFNLKNLNINDSTLVTVNYRIIPIVESGQILDTISMSETYVTQTTTEEEYVAERTLRPIKAAMINPADERHATITFGDTTSHLKWTEIRYKNAKGDFTDIRIKNSETEKFCQDIARREVIKIRCAYNPPETDIELVSEWTDYAPFILKHDPVLEGWSVLPRTDSHSWGADGQGKQTLWNGGHPMLILDNDPGSGWHSKLDNPFPQVLVIDMHKKKRVSKVIANGGYWKTVELYLTDDLSIPEHIPYKVVYGDEDDDKERVENYDDWMDPLMELIPEDVPASWGAPIAVSNEGAEISFLFPEIPEGRFLIMRFPDNIYSPGGTTYINVNNVEVYSD